MKNIYTQDFLTNLLHSEPSNTEEEVDMSHGQEGPTEWTIQKILGFSKSFNVKSSQVLGSFEEMRN